MKVREFLAWLFEAGRITGLFDNLRNFLICGTIVYLGIHLLRLAGPGPLGLLDRVFSGAIIAIALGLMLLNLVAGYRAIAASLGRGISLLVSILYLVLALYVVLAMTTTKMHAGSAARDPGHIPFSIFD